MLHRVMDMPPSLCCPFAHCSCPSKGSVLCVQAPEMWDTTRTPTIFGVTETRSKGSAPVWDQGRLGAMVAWAGGRRAGPLTAAWATTGRGRGGGLRRTTQSWSGYTQVRLATCCNLARGLRYPVQHLIANTRWPCCAELDELRRQRGMPPAAAPAPPAAGPGIEPGPQPRQQARAQQVAHGAQAYGAAVLPYEQGQPLADQPQLVQQQQQVAAAQAVQLQQLQQQQAADDRALATLRVQVESLQQQLTAVAARLQVRDAQAKKYKEAAKLLKVKASCTHCRRSSHSVRMRGAFVEQMHCARLLHRFRIGAVACCAVRLLS